MIEYELSGTENARTQDTSAEKGKDGKAIPSLNKVDTVSRTNPLLLKDPAAVNWLYSTDEGRKIREKGIPKT